jgi:hypothetical protein
MDGGRVRSSTVPAVQTLHGVQVRGTTPGFGAEKDPAGQAEQVRSVEIVGGAASMYPREQLVTDRHVPTASWYCVGEHGSWSTRLKRPLHSGTRPENWTELESLSTLPQKLIRRYAIEGTVCVCVRERERERGREREKRERERERERHRQTDRQTESIHTYTCRERDRQTDRQTDRKSRDRAREGCAHLHGCETHSTSLSSRQLVEGT